MAVITDDFNRTDEDLEASANWSLVSGVAGDFFIVGNQLKMIASTCYYIHNSGCGDQDHYSQMDVLNDLEASAQFGVCCRMDPATSDGDGYMMMVDGYASQIARLRRTDGLSRSTLSSTTAAVTNGDTLYVEAEGSAIEGQIVGVETEATTDTTYSGAGKDHGGLYGTNGSSAYILDNYESAPVASVSTWYGAAAGSLALTGTAVGSGTFYGVASASLTITGTAVGGAGTGITGTASLDLGFLGEVWDTQSITSIAYMVPLAPVGLGIPALIPGPLPSEMPTLSPVVLPVPNATVEGQSQTRTMPVLSPVAFSLPVLIRENDPQTRTMLVLSPVALGLPRVRLLGITYIYHCPSYQVRVPVVGHTHMGRRGFRGHHPHETHEFNVLSEDGTTFTRSVTLLPEHYTTFAKVFQGGRLHVVTAEEREALEASGVGGTFTLHTE